MKSCPACRAQCQDDAWQCWQCEYVYRAPTADEREAVEEEPVPFAPKDSRRLPSFTPRLALALGLVALGVASALLTYQVVGDVLVPGAPKKLWLLPLDVVVLPAGGIVLLSRQSGKARGLGTGVVLLCAASLASAVGGAFRTATNMGVIGGDSPPSSSVGLSVVWLDLFIGIFGIAGLVLFATWAVRTRAAGPRPRLVLIAAGFYALGQLIGFIQGLIPADVPPQFEATSAEQFVSALGAGAATAIFVAAITVAAITRSAWCVVGLGAAWAIGLAVNAVVIAIFYGVGSLSECLTICNALWLAGLAVAIVAAARDQESQTADAPPEDQQHGEL